MSQGPEDGLAAQVQALARSAIKPSGYEASKYELVLVQSTIGQLHGDNIITPHGRTAKRPARKPGAVGSHDKACQGKDDYNRCTLATRRRVDCEATATRLRYEHGTNTVCEHLGTGWSRLLRLESDSNAIRIP